MKQCLNVLYQTSNMYVPYAGVSIISLLINNKDINDICIYYLSEKITKKNKIKLQSMVNDYGRKIIFIDTNDIIKQLEDFHIPKYNGSYATYCKMFVISRIKENIEMLLYIDADTIIEGSLKDIIDLDFEGKICAAALDCIYQKYKNIIGLKSDDMYYNMGIVAFNIPLWKKMNCEERILSYMSNIKNSMYAEQDIINLLFLEKIKCIELKYNFNTGFLLFGTKMMYKLYNLSDTIYYSTKQIKEAYKDVRIYHCVGGLCGRPWEKNNIHPLEDLFDKYIKLSPWKDFEKIHVPKFGIFKIQRFLYKILPKFIYVPIHKISLNIYYKKK